MTTVMSPRFDEIERHPPEDFEAAAAECPLREGV
jgi:hypothetical protein